MSGSGSFTSLGNNRITDITGAGGAFTSGVSGDLVGSTDYVVTGLADVIDATDDDYVLSLREAVIDANSANETIWVPAWEHRFTISGLSTTATTGDLDITSAVTVVGAGAGLTVIDADGLDRIFEVRTGGDLDISGITLTGGSVTGTSGGAINILDGYLTISDSSLVGNTAEYGGGALYVGPNSDGVTITGSVISDNEVTGGSGGGIGTAMAGVNVGSTIVANNTASSSNEDLYVSGSGSFTSLGNNRITDITGAGGAFTNGVNGDLVGSVDFVVTGLADSYKDSDDSYVLSLREAVDNANNASGSQEIWLPAWDFRLTREVTGTDDITVGDLEVSNTLTVRGTKNTETTIDNVVNVDAVFEEVGSGDLTLLDADDTV